MLCILEVTQTGTLYVYQGQELGLKNFPRTWDIAEYKDVATQNYYNLLVFLCYPGWISLTNRAHCDIRIKAQRQKAEQREDVDVSDLLDNFQHKARDHARTPMQVRPGSAHTSLQHTSII